VPSGNESAQHHRDNNCIACHMPHRKNEDILHTTVIDHRILRRPHGVLHRAGHRAGRPAGQPQPGQFPLVHFHKDLEGVARAEVSRDLGLAMLDTAGQQALPPWARAQVGRLAFVCRVYSLWLLISPLGSPPNVFPLDLSGLNWTQPEVNGWPFTVTFPDTGTSLEEPPPQPLLIATRPLRVTSMRRRFPVRDLGEDMGNSAP
jgi:hypothetical protein